MADLSALLQPRVRDRAGLQEFIEDLIDRVPVIERDVARLKQDPGDRELIADLFRALHTVKGDAALCKVDLAVLLMHPIETLLARTRSGEIAFSDLLAEVILLALDRLELAVELLAGDRSFAHLKLVELVGGLDALAETPPARIADRCITLIEAVTGFRPAQAMARGVALQPFAEEHGSKKIAEDLAFFRQLALQFETRSPLFNGRTARLLRLARDTNAAAGRPVDPAQLEATVYMHDIGMMFLPESAWLKSAHLTAEERQLLRAHPADAAGLLQRMPGWTEAARIVAEHHEMPAGTGYPGGLKGDAICAGAKILAIVDAFEAVMLKHSHRGHSRSLLRAIAEINACDNQFAPEWIGHFNSVVRRMVES